MAKSQEERAEDRVYATWAEAMAALNARGGKTPNRVYRVALPTKTVYVVAPSPAAAVGYGAVVEGFLPEALEVTNPVKDVDIQRQELHRQLGELERGKVEYEEYRRRKT